MSKNKSIFKIASTGYNLTPEQREKLKIEPDKDGFYRVPVGGLNCYNSSGLVYIGDRNVKAIFDSEDLKRRMVRNALGIEVGHPKLEDSPSIEHYLIRLRKIYENNICGIIGAIDLVETDQKLPFLEDNIIHIYAHIKPDGVHGEMLRKKLEDPTLNLAFSIRSMIDDQVVIPGITFRYITNFITFDFVNEGGISFAQKYLAIGLESFEESVFNKDLLTLDLGNEESRNKVMSLLNDEIIQSQGNESQLDLLDALKAEVNTYGQDKDISYGSMYE